MNKTQELITIINANPDRELIFMYPEEGSDHPYTMGHPRKMLVDEYWVDDDKVWLRYENEDEIFDHYADFVFDELFPNEKFTNVEQDKIVIEKTKELIESQEWKKCICVYIRY